MVLSREGTSPNCNKVGSAPVVADLFSDGELILGLILLLGDRLNAYCSCLVGSLPIVELIDTRSHSYL